MTWMTQVHICLTKTILIYVGYRAKLVIQLELFEKVNEAFSPYPHINYSNIIFVYI